MCVRIYTNIHMHIHVYMKYVYMYMVLEYMGNVSPYLHLS